MDRMRILLIQPNSTEEVNKEYLSLQFPLNLGYIAAVLREAGHNVRMVDFNVMDRKKLSMIILNFKPEMIGLTALTSSIYNAKKIISEIKQIDKNIVTILGGVHASALPIETIEEIRDLDYLVFGEGERTIVELTDCLIKKKSIKDVGGVVFRNAGKIIKNKPRRLIEDLDSLPLPARDLIPFQLYAKHHVTRGFSRKEKNIIEIMTSRGCPNKCIFCAGHINYGFRVRFRSYENIVKEINESIECYGINHISIEDDTFTLNKDLVRKLCVFFKNKNLTWNCNTRVNTVDYNLLKLMAESGCKKITFGIESGNSEILKKNKKAITIEQAIKTVKDAKRAKIRYVECDFMIGSHIDETLETVHDTIKLIYKLMPDFLSLAIMCPFPGTEVYDLMIKNNLLDKEPDWSQFTVFGNLRRYKKLNYLSSEEMFRLQHKILKEYYSSKKYILLQLIKIKNLSEIKYFSRLAISFFKEFF